MRPLMDKQRDASCLELKPGLARACVVKSVRRLKNIAFATRCNMDCDFASRFILDWKNTPRHDYPLPTSTIRAPLLPGTTDRNTATRPDTAGKYVSIGAPSEYV